MLHAMMGGGIDPDSVTYNAVIDAHVRAGFGRADSPALMAKWKATLDDADHPATALLRA